MILEVVELRECLEMLRTLGRTWGGGMVSTLYFSPALFGGSWHTYGARYMRAGNWSKGVSADESRSGSVGDTEPFGALVFWGGGGLP